MHLFMYFACWIHCRLCHWYNNFLRHNHFHCILLLLCLLPILPLSYNRHCGRHPTASSTLRIKSYPYDNDAANTSSSAGQLQPATSRLPTASFGTQSASSALPKLPSAFNSASPSSKISSSRCDASRCRRCSAGETLTDCTRQPSTPAFFTNETRHLIPLKTSVSLKSNTPVVD